jgi:hypothetical protein
MTQAFQPLAFTAEQARRDTSWILRLGAEEARGIDEALQHARRLGKPHTAMTQADFPLPAVSQAALTRAIAGTQGRWGMCLVKGLPIETWSEDDCRLAYWGMSLYMGTARTQNKTSDHICDVRDEGASYKAKGGRGYNTSAGLDFHCDSCDVVALLCRRDAKEGGESKVVSSIALRDAIAARRPELIAVLQGPWYHSYQGAQAPGQPPFYMCPILGSDPVHFAVRSNRKNIVAAQRDFPEVPRLTPLQLEALDLMDELMASPELCFSMWLERGDMQLLNNYVTLHSRTDFEDHEERDLKRHLFRLWLAVPTSQPLPPEWQTYFGDVRAGAVRGGLAGSFMSEDFRAYEARQAEAMGMPYRPRSTPADTPSVAA